MDKIINHFNEVDMSEMQLPMIVIYESPKDYYGKYVARLFDTSKPTNIVKVAMNLNTIIDSIDHYRFTFIGRGELDEKNIIGVYM